MASDSKHDTSTPPRQNGPGISALLQVGVIAATSALAGGIAVALWHRKTLSKLQNPANTPNLPNSIFSDDSEN